MTQPQGQIQSGVHKRAGIWARLKAFLGRILRFLGRILRFLLGVKPDEEPARETLGHALIALLVTLSLAVFDAGARWVGTFQSRNSKWIAGILGVLVLLPVVFLALYHFDRLLRKIIFERPLKLDLGGPERPEPTDVNGTYVDAVIKREANKFVVWRGSIFQIDSSYGEGFRFLDGRSYGIKDGNVENEQAGSFNSLKSGHHGNRIAYLYTGGDKASSGSQEGAVFYKFESGIYSVSNEGAIFFKGGFISKELDHAFHVIGMKAPGEGEHARAFLNEFVKSKEVQEYIKQLHKLPKAT